MSDAYSCSSSRRSATAVATRSEEHTSELQSQSNLVCRLLLGKKKHTSELQSQSNLVCRLLLEKKKIKPKVIKIKTTHTIPPSVLYRTIAQYCEDARSSRLTRHTHAS